MTGKHDELVARLEAAEAGSRELDAKIALQTGWAVYPGDDWIGPYGEICVPSYTSSLDAALALAERLGLDPINALQDGLHAALRTGSIPTKPAKLTVFVCASILRATGASQ